MAHHNTILLIIGLTAISSLCVNGQFQFFHRPIRPLYLVHKTPNQPANNDQQINKSPINFNHPPNSQEDEKTRFLGIGRADLELSSSEEEGQNDSSSSGEHPQARRRNATSLPPNFDASVRANRPPLEPRPRRPMYGDPAVMEDDDEEQDRSRYLWPFSTTVTVSKTKNGHGHGLGPPPHLSGHYHGPPLLPPHITGHHHGHHGHKGHADLDYEKTRLKYHDYVEQMYNTAQGIHEPHHGHHHDKYLTNEEILHSKGSSRPPSTSPNQKVSSPPSPSWGLSLPSLNLRGGLLSRLLISNRKFVTKDGETPERFPSTPPQKDAKKNQFRTENINKNTKMPPQNNRNGNKGKNKNLRNKEAKKEKVKKTIYSILINTMDALDKEKDD